MMKIRRFKEFDKYKQYELRQKLEKLESKVKINLDNLAKLMNTSDGRYSISAVLDVILELLPQYNNPIYLAVFIQTHLEFQCFTCEQRQNLLEVVPLIEQCCNIVRQNKLSQS